VRWQFKEKTPTSVVVVLLLFATNTLVQISTAFSIPRWFQQTSDSTHTYPIRFKGGAIYFVQPSLGKYFDWGFEIGFVLLALLFLLLWLHRDKLERVG